VRLCLRHYFVSTHGSESITIMEISNNLTPQISDAATSTKKSVPASFSQGPPLRQGSPEWKALLYQNGPARDVVLPPEATSREAIYGDDLQ